mgnify:CR=1 FL=1
MNGNKKAALLQSKQTLFHTRDLAVLWNIQNPNTLYTTISRYIRNQTLFPVQKGLYSTLPVEKVDPIELGIFLLHQFAYVSTETILVQSGIIHQALYRYTFVSDVSKNFTGSNHQYVARKLTARYLYHPAGITINDRDIATASVERAVADLLYFQPTYNFDAAGTIDWEKVHEIQKEVAYV